MSRGDHIPFAVPAVGMRRQRRCPVCGKLFFCTQEHGWVAFIPKDGEVRAVCSHACMRAMERKLGRRTAREIAMQDEEAQGEQPVCTVQDEVFALLRRKDELEHQLMPLTRMIERAYERKRVAKMGSRQRRELFDREQRLMRELGEVNRRIREAGKRGNDYGRTAGTQGSGAPGGQGGTLR